MVTFEVIQGHRKRFDRVSYSETETNLLPYGEGPSTMPTPRGRIPQQCRALILWQCFHSQRCKTGELSIQNAPDCTNLRLKFKIFPGVTQTCQVSRISRETPTF